MSRRSSELSEVQAFDLNGEYANGCAAKDIHQQRSPRKANRIVQRHPAHGGITHEVAGDRAEYAAQSDQKYRSRLLMLWPWALWFL